MALSLLGDRTFPRLGASLCYFFFLTKARRQPGEFLGEVLPTDSLYNVPGPFLIKKRFLNGFLSSSPLFFFRSCGLFTMWTQLFYLEPLWARSFTFRLFSIPPPGPPFFMISSGNLPLFFIHPFIYLVFTLSPQPISLELVFGFGIDPFPCVFFVRSC